MVRSGMEMPEPCVSSARYAGWGALLIRSPMSLASLRLHGASAINGFHGLHRSAHVSQRLYMIANQTGEHILVVILMMIIIVRGLISIIAARRKI